MQSDSDCVLCGAKQSKARKAKRERKKENGKR